MGKCTTPCGECPYLKKSTPNYFGGNDGQEFLDAISDESVVYCHTRGVYDMNEEIIPDQSTICAGQALAQINSCKSSMNPKVIVTVSLIKKRGDIGALQARTLSAFNFKDHHTSLRSKLR